MPNGHLRHLLLLRPRLATMDQTLVQGSRCDLADEVLVVHQGQVEEHLLQAGHLPVLSRGDRPGGNLDGFRVGAIRPGRTAEDVSRELVEEEQEGQGASRLLCPALQLRGVRLVDKGAELVSDGFVEVWVRHEPSFDGVFPVKPKRDGAIDGGVHG